ncbi:hypothetical protein J6500_22130 [Bradyrhizobium sp. WSM 1704]|uniref:hypothetical protein n=1 Tax=Bradyrhizobium semiaridum TaxID=2821404 RepID=UPI001CE33A7D|nr:hypothetical protein [Bradyrhizobium semiaridum]MCA6124570.1 hypothetical protein [Bradyrhizobium semiaridum]
MAPSLRIPIDANLDQFKAAMENTSTLGRAAARKVAKEFATANADIIKDTAMSAARFAAPWTAQVAVIVGSIKLISAAISGAREQMQQMVAIADKAQNLGVSPAFLQGFTNEAKKLKIGVDDLEGALAHAFDATKEKSPIDVNEWTVGEEKITDVEKALRVYNETLAKAAGQRLEGLVEFRNATDQDQKIKAVLAAMIQLDQIGQHAASLDLGEKMFGSAFVDRIRQGKTSAESMLATIKDASANSDGIFSNVLVNRAKEVDDQLKVADQRLRTALKPAWDDLASVITEIKSTWASVVDLIARGVELSNQIKIPGFTSNTDIDAKRSALDTVNRRLNGTSGWTETYGILASRETLEAHRDRLQKEIAALAQGDQYGPPAPSVDRGTGAAPKKIQTGSDHDRFDGAADAIDKRTAALKAEAEGLDLSTAARERNKIAAQLQEVAMQANKAAGLGEGVVTDAQRKRIEEVTSAYEKATEALERNTVAQSIRRGRQTALLDPQDVQIAEQLKGLYPDVATALASTEAAAMRTNEALKSIGNTMSSTLTSGLADILDGTKSVSDGFASMAKSIARSIEEAVIKAAVVAPLLRSFGLGGSGSIIPGFADGTDFAPGGLALVGERGPELVNLPRGSKVFPNHVSAQMARDISGATGGGASGGPMISSNQITVAPSIEVTVQGGAGQSSADHERMGATIAKSLETRVQRMIGEAIMKQIKPGGILKR